MAWKRRRVFKKPIKMPILSKFLIKPLHIKKIIRWKVVGNGIPPYLFRWVIYYMGCTLFFMNNLKFFISSTLLAEISVLPSFVFSSIPPEFYTPCCLHLLACTISRRWVCGVEIRGVSFCHQTFYNVLKCLKWLHGFPFVQNVYAGEIFQ